MDTEVVTMVDLIDRQDVEVTISITDIVVDSEGCPDGHKETFHESSEDGVREIPRDQIVEASIDEDAISEAIDEAIREDYADRKMCEAEDKLDDQEWEKDQQLNRMP